MNDEQKYLFDLQGYLVLKNVVPPGVIEACNWAMDYLEALDPSDYPEPLCLGTERTKTELYIANILEGAPAFQPLINLPQVIDIVQSVSGETFRLNHTYATWRWESGYTGIHNHGTPIMDKFQYRCQNGQIISTLTKAVFPMYEANSDCSASLGNEQSSRVLSFSCGHY